MLEKNYYEIIKPLWFLKGYHLSTSYSYIYHVRPKSIILILWIRNQCDIIYDIWEINLITIIFLKKI